jgi:intracellular multiplication protein IcmO
MAAPIFRAPEEHHEIDPRELRRDTRPLLQNLYEYILSPLGLAVTGIGFASINVAAPSFTLAGLVAVPLLIGISVLYHNSLKDRLHRLPLRLPLDAGDLPDYSNPYPGRNGYRKGEGAIFLGNSIGGGSSRGKEIWASFTDMLTHQLVLGGTGAGKTETLVSMAFNDVAVGGGLGYIDAKAAPKLYGQMWFIARICGRDDDMRVLNFALGQEKLDKTPRWRSNTMQPFSFGKAESLKEIPLSLMAGGGGGNNGIFEANGKALMTALMMALVEMRDKGEIYLYPGDIIHYMNQSEFVALAKRKDFTQTTQNAIQSFLSSMGWLPDVADPNKWGDFLRQYSYAQNYFLETFSTMNITYRHIFAARIGDINLTDVILQRRIFVTMIPSLEKSKKELESIGKITLSALRLATAVGLGGGEIMGSWKRRIKMGIAMARVPFFLKIDEVAAILVEGLAEMFTQGRGLGISCTVGSQDWAGIMGANEIAAKEAQQMLSNTKLKYFMTGDDPKETKKLIEELADETDEFRTQGFAVNGLINYYDTLSAQAQRVKRVNALDIAAQIEGEWHLFFKGKIIRGQGFHAGATPEDNEFPMFVHHFLQVLRPEYSSLSARFGVLKETLDQWADIAERRDDQFAKEFTHEAPAELLYVLANPGNRFNDPSMRRELACAAVYHWMTQQKSASSVNRVESNVVPDDEMNEEMQRQKESVHHSAPPVSFSIPGVDMIHGVVAKIDPPDAKDVDDSMFVEEGDEIMADVGADGGGDLGQIIEAVLAKPSYPLPPKPKPISTDQFHASTRQWLDSIAKKK